MKFRHVNKVPTLDANSDAKWIFDVAAKRPLTARLFTVMTGSVVTSGKKKTDSKKRSAQNNKENMGPSKRGRGTGAAGKAKAKAKCLALPNIPDECDVTNATVSCTVGVRNKLWVDDMLRCVDHVTSNVVSLYGASSDVGDDLKHHLIEQCTLFAFKDTIMLESQKGPKQFKKWSTLRPALKEHAQLYLMKDIEFNHFLSFIYLSNWQMFKKSCQYKYYQQSSK